MFQSDSHHFCSNSVGSLWMQAGELGDRDSSWAATPLPQKRNTFWCIAVSLPWSYVVFSPRDQVMPILGSPPLALFCYFTSKFLSWVSKHGYFGFSASRMGTARGYTLSESHLCTMPPIPSSLIKITTHFPTVHGHCCHDHLSAVVLKMGPRASSVSITQNLLEMYILRPYPRPTESEAVGVGSQLSVF